VNTLLLDLRYAVRLLLKTPGFTAVAILVLALGIGANTAIFSIVNAMVLAPIPSDGEAIVGIYSRDRSRPDSYRSFSWQSYEQMRESRELFDQVMAHTMTMVGAGEGASTRRSFAAIVSSSYFDTLGVRLASGRGFTGDEQRPGAGVRVVIVGHPYAGAHGATPAGVLGQTVRINGRDYTIVGVTPEGFAGTMALIAPEFWLPTGAYESVMEQAFTSRAGAPLADPTNRPLMLVGRLRPGLTAEAAKPMLASLSQRFEQDDPVGYKAQDLMVQKLSRLSVSTSPRDDSETFAVWILLMGMAGVVLVIACLNLANMLLARGTARRREIALRLALGSGRARVIRQLLTESLLLALVGGTAGLLLAVWGTRLLTATFASVLPMVVTFDASPDPRVLAATLVFSVLATLTAGLGPAWRTTRPDVLPDLKEQPAEQGGGRRFSMRNMLVVGQVALSLALLTAAGLFMRGAVKAAVADPGYALEGGLVVRVDPSLGGYDETRGRATMRSILQRVRTTPGVQAASIGSIVPFGEFQEGRIVQKAGTPPAADGERDAGVDSTYVVVGADYFDTMRLPVRRGRGFTTAEEESAGGAPFVIIDEPLARQLFGGEDPIGQRIQFPRRDDRPDPGALEIVGVVAGVRHDMFDKVPVPHVYLPFGRNYRGGMNIHMRLDSATPEAEAAMLGTMRREIRAVDADVPIISMQSLRQHRDKSIVLWVVNAGARLFSVFGGVALLLAVIGVYGVKSYVVSRRTREIGIRMALGATPEAVLWLVMREGLALTLTGIGIGLLLSWGVARAVSGMLYEVSPLDPVVFAAAPLTLIAAALLASYVPARRATHVRPMTALRAE
jgi:putative ABC transport system permease protein